MALVFSHNLPVVPLLCPSFLYPPLCLSPSSPVISQVVLLFMGVKARSDVVKFPSRLWHTYCRKEAACWRRHWSSHTRRETFRLLPSGKEFVRLHTQKTRRCVSGPGLEAAGLLYCSRWCTISIYKKTLSVGSKEEVLSSIPASNTAALNHFVAAWTVTLYGFLLWHDVWTQWCFQNYTIGKNWFTLNHNWYLLGFWVDSQFYWTTECNTWT